MSENVLKPCPFCGDTYIIARTITCKYEDSMPITKYRYKTKYKIGCNSLGCVCLHTEGRLFDTEEEAIKAWDRRVGESDDKN